MKASSPPDPNVPEPPVQARGPRKGDFSWLRSRVLVFAGFSTLCVIAAAAYVVWAVRRDGSANASGDSGIVIAETAGAALVANAGPTLLFSNRSGDHNHRVAVVPLESPESARRMTGLTCQRIHYAAGRGLCLGEGGARAANDLLAIHGYVFGPDFKITHDVSLGGFPSRVRISPDGRYGATTVFVSGHSYADAGFSTETTLINLETGFKIGNLEQFTLLRDGQRFNSIDFNYWGVTFARDGDRFYATLGTGGRTYLVEGSVTERRMRTVRENVECPSLSPDGTRLAFKKRVGGLVRAVWRFHVLELPSLTETALTELRSIDDQIEWFDDRQVLYGDGSTIWIAAADGYGQPRKFLSQASSPTVLRTTLPAASVAEAGTSVVVDNAPTLQGADLSVAVIPSASEIAAGELLGYTVTVTNHGPADATNLKVDHLMPSDVTFVGTPTATNPGRGYGCALYEDQQRVSCDTPLLPNAGTWTISLKIRVGPARTVSARVVVSGDQPDPHPDNDSTVAQTTVRAVR